MLLNIAEPIPTEFFVFVDKMNLMAQLNLQNTNIFFSGTVFHWNDSNFIEKYLNGKVDYLPFVINTKKDTKVVSAFENSLTAQYRTEYNAEMHRTNNFPHYPSRLSAVFAFGDFETCKQVSLKHKWDLSSVKRFKLLPNNLNKVAKVNMEIVSLDRYVTKVLMSDAVTISQIWNSYWTGLGNVQLELPTVEGRKLFYSDVIWEYLIEGQVQLIA